MSDHHTRGVAESIASARFDDIPDEIVDHTKLLILDTGGPPGLGAPWSAMLASMLGAINEGRPVVSASTSNI